MSSATIERLHYYQGQYLGAQDFADEQSYHRDQRRRHNLGPHTWGIIVGLELVEQPKGDGDAVDVVVQPGMAIDGYGREIVLLQPRVLDPEKFRHSRDKGDFEVWIGYCGRQIGRAAAGYASCDPDQHDRVQEECFLAVKPETPQDEIVVNGEELTSPVQGNDTMPISFSVPYQELPEDAEKHWLVRLGSVFWNGSALVRGGRLAEGRQYAGMITGSLYASDDELHIARRPPLSTGAPNGQDSATNDEGEEWDLAVTVEGELSVEDEVTALAGVNLDGGLIAFSKPLPQDDEGLKRPFAILRKADELRVQFSEGESSRLAIGIRSDQKFTPSFAVTSSGFVGIGTSRPEQLLQVGDGRTEATLALRKAALAFEDDKGTNGFQLRYDAEAGTLRLRSDETEDDSIIAFQKHEQYVGIGTDMPQERLDVNGKIRFGEGGRYFPLGALHYMQMIAGDISANGTVNLGSDCFRVEREEKNTSVVYKIVFHNVPNFVSRPVVVISPVTAIRMQNDAVIRRILKGEFEIEIFGDKVGSRFTFIAIGPSK